MGVFAEHAVSSNVFINIGDIFKKPSKDLYYIYRKGCSLVEVYKKKISLKTREVQYLSYHSDTTKTAEYLGENIEKNGNTFLCLFNPMFDRLLRLSRYGMHKSLQCELISILQTLSTLVSNFPRI